MDISEKIIPIVNFIEMCAAIFPEMRRNNLSSIMKCHELSAITDAKDRHVEGLERFEIEIRRVHLTGALRSAGEDDRRRLALGDLRRGDAVRNDLGVHLQLADPPRDQLGVLGAEVDDEHGGAVEMLRLNQDGES